MTTAIAVYDSDGCVGRCDARCHEATSDACRCICGGALHGAGGAAAASAILGALGADADLLARYAELRELDLDGLRIEHAQGRLFDPGAVLSPANGRFGAEALADLGAANRPQGPGGLARDGKTTPHRPGGMSGS